MKYWSIVLKNYRDEDDVCYFDNYSAAKETFENLCEKYKNKDEFKRVDNVCSWFDPSYNEYSTLAVLRETTIPIFKDPIDL